MQSVPKEQSVLGTKVCVTINFQQQIKDMDDPSDLLYYFHITRWQDVYNVHITTYEEYE
jgi:hypothetical protein